MEAKLVQTSAIAIAMLLLGLSGLLVDANNWPASAYIYQKKSDIQFNADFYEIVSGLVEERGSEEPERTAELLGEVEKNMDEMMIQSIGLEDSMIMIDLEQDKYGVLQTIQPDFWTQTVDGCRAVAGHLSALAGDLSELLNCNQATLHFYLDTVKWAFGKDLEAFVSEPKPAHDTKLHAYLLHYGKRLAQFCLGKLSKPMLVETGSELMMDQIVSEDKSIKLSQSDLLLLGKARDLDLWTTSRVTEMLKASESKHSTSAWSRMMSPKKSLANARDILIREIIAICEEFNQESVEMLNFYNLARLLVPDEAAKLEPSIRFRKLSEYLRICAQPSRAHK